MHSQDVVYFSNFDCLADPATEPELLPQSLAPRDNSRRLRHYKRAMRHALQNRLTPAQRELVLLHHEQGLRKSDIARERGCSPAAVGKALRLAEQALRSHVEQYMEIYDSIERELLRD